MAKRGETVYKLCSKNGSEWKEIKGLPTRLQELDKYTRNFSDDASLAVGLFVGGHNDVSINDTYRINYLKIYSADILFKEKYTPRNRDKMDIYTQIMTFAEALHDEYKRSIVITEERATVPEDKAFNVLARIKGIPNPRGFKNKKFVKFICEYFLDKVPVFSKRAEDEIYKTALVVFKNKLERGEEYNIELENNYYQAILEGFHRIFYSRNKKTNEYSFSYPGARRFYTEYYNKLIATPEEVKKEEPVVQTSNVKEDNSRYLNSDGSVTQMYIEEAMNLRSDYFPDEHKNDETIKRDEDGNYLFR